MSKDTRNVPALRFKGFSDAWEKRCLKEILSVNSGRDYKHLLPGKVPVYGTGGYMLSVNEALSHSDAIGIGRKGTIDRPFFLKAPFWTVDTLFFLTVKKEMVLSFVFPLLQTIRWKQLDESTGVPSLSKKTIESIMVHVPQKEEQQIIGNTFILIDNLIAATQDKLEKLSVLQRGFLQHFFAQTWRFSGYSHAWENYRLGDVSTRVRGNDGRMNLPILTISAGKGWLTQEQRFSQNIAGNELKKYTLLSKGELSYNHGNSKLAEYGAVFVLKQFKEALVPRVYHSFNISGKADPDFIEYLFESGVPNHELRKLISSGARMDGLLNINYGSFMNISVRLPSIEEQNKIARVLEKLKKLTDETRLRLFNLQQAKKSLLRMLFP
ncbi:restriction endonuclease subunit S [Lacticaseibacillus rhamnosus]|uniref:restriction endonuclease subunit S n=1 Tax=Lacticaseibacillus rhamnosus TaxID=47715 RepID=UPI000BBD5AD2|nr:restriction endonuclease subunit S [Lacticaseibacillus rhamnosus]PCL26888.1 restriction endonuclease subunit S [Lacticaseibacillus rhamnosus]